jgi:hypothetical protein
LAARALSFLRLLLVAKILGDLRAHEYGLYRPALELTNPLVALVMFGAADVAERYASAVERSSGGPGLARFLRIQQLRLLLTGISLFALMALTSPWLSRAIWGESAIPLLIASAGTIVILALYQHLAAALRGLRAFSASAGLELSSNFLLLIFSLIAAKLGNATTLLLAYAASLLLPLAFYWVTLARHFGTIPASSAPAAALTPPADALSYASPDMATPSHSRFARWSLVRLLLVMSFAFVSLWGVRYLTSVQIISANVPATGPAENDVLRTTADYSMTFTIAQLLAYVALLLWSSTYGIAARAWSHQQTRRARVLLFRVGKFGGVLLLLAATFLLLTRGLIASFLPDTYAYALNNLLPAFLAMFIWYGLLAFSSTYADLQEKPHRGAALWATAVAIQLAGIFAARLLHFDIDPRAYVLNVSTAGIAIALFITAPLLLYWPLRFRATGFPMVIIALAPISLLAPNWVVDYIATPILLAALLLLLITGQLYRPVDRRALRRFLQRPAT